MARGTRHWNDAVTNAHSFFYPQDLWVRRLYEPLWAGVLYLGLAAPLQGLLNLGLHTSALRALTKKACHNMLVEQTYASLG